VLALISMVQIVSEQLGGFWHGVATTLAVCLPTEGSWCMARVARYILSLFAPKRRMMMFFVVVVMVSVGGTYYSQVKLFPNQGTPHSRNEPIEQAKNETTSRFFNIKSFVAKKVDIFSKKVKGRQ
jgi:hypothetical protein